MAMLAIISCIHTTIESARQQHVGGKAPQEGRTGLEEGALVAFVSRPHNSSSRDPGANRAGADMRLSQARSNELNTQGCPSDSQNKMAETLCKRPVTPPRYAAALHGIFLRESILKYLMLGYALSCFLWSAAQEGPSEDLVKFWISSACCLFWLRPVSWSRPSSVARVSAARLGETQQDNRKSVDRSCSP